MPWRLKIEDPENGECWSSDMTKERAVTFARDLLGDVSVLGMESDAGEVLDAEAAQALIDAVPKRSAKPRLSR